MVARHAEAEWKGDGPHGEGHMRLESGTLDAPFDFRSRMENGKGTNPEELLGAAHAGCFSMQLAFMLTKAGTPPARIHTKADVHFGPKGEGFAISRIDLHTRSRRRWQAWKSIWMRSCWDSSGSRSAAGVAGGGAHQKGRSPT
jgi:osmotically inducible protein OsmC